jgi:hypothetical protein
MEVGQGPNVGCSAKGKKKEGRGMEKMKDEHLCFGWNHDGRDQLEAQTGGHY